MDKLRKPYKFAVGAHSIVKLVLIYGYCAESSNLMIFDWREGSGFLPLMKFAEYSEASFQLDLGMHPMALTMQ